jgi:hypothetical protein
MVCIGFVCASCIFAALNTVMSNSSRDVPACTQRCVGALYPFCMFESYRRPKHSVVLPVAAQNNVVDPRSVEGGANNEGATNEIITADPMKAIDWADVSRLADRCFFVLHILVSVVTVAGFLSYGYYPWQNFAKVAFADAQWLLVCYEGRLQGASHVEAICSERFDNWTKI